jgi:uncharacterized SAM-binding protein YcdF (DUF218 family)
VYEPLRIVTQPLTVLLLLLVVTTLMAARARSRASWRWSAFLLALLSVVVCHPYAAWWLAHALEAQYPARDPNRLGGVRALVVLSGGILAGADGRGELAEDSLARTVCAAELTKHAEVPLVLVTGGVVNPAAPVAVAQRMRDLLVTFGVPDARILVEPRAMTTVGNARESWALLAPRGLRRIGLMTDALHMPRSVGTFRAVGFDVDPLPCHVQTGQTFRWSPSTLLPGSRAAWLFNRAVHEWIGLGYYRLRGDWR